jgi:hypothetical protein
MPKPDADETPRSFRGPSLVFGYACFGLAVLTIGAAIAILPLEGKVRAFLSAAAALLFLMFGFMAVAAHVALRASESRSRSVTGEDGPLSQPRKAPGHLP